MRRRDFITLVGVTAAGWPLAARAERPPFLVGTIGSAPYWAHFREAMRDLGYREGQNIKYELRTGETEPARLAEAAKDLTSIPVDAIVAFGTPSSQAAQEARSQLRFCPDVRGLQPVRREQDHLPRPLQSGLSG